MYKYGYSFMFFVLLHLAEDLSIVSIVSVTLSQLVRSYISSNNGLRHFLRKYVLILDKREKDDKELGFVDLFKRLGNVYWNITYDKLSETMIT